jgi:signal transduction histidine kinase
MSDFDTNPESPLPTPAWLANADAATLRRVIDTLHRVHGFITDITDINTLLERIMEESKKIAGAEASSLLLYDRRAGELFFHVALGESGDQQVLKQGVRLRLGEGIAGSAAQLQKSINVHDAPNDPRFFRQADAATQFETRNILAVPLTDRGKLVGVLEVLNKIDGDAFTEFDIALMEMFAGIVGTAIANARLIEANMRSQRLAAIGQAVTAVSHHTKNIITGLGAGVDVIDQALEQEQYDTVERTWPVLKRSTRRIANFVEDMLAISKPRRPVRAPVDLKTIIKDVEETFWALLASRDVVLSIDTTDATETVSVDDRAIFRCLLNLLINAADAVPQTGGQIRITATTSADVILEVADNGSGVPVNKRKHIFDLFYSTKGSKGTGLGLAVAQKIAQEHKGHIEIEDAPEGGALFRVTLPKAIAKQSADSDDLENKF